jgi:hypothetical protein
MGKKKINHRDPRLIQGEGAYVFSHMNLWMITDCKHGHCINPHVLIRFFVFRHSSIDRSSSSKAISDEIGIKLAMWVCSVSPFFQNTGIKGLHCCHMCRISVNVTRRNVPVGNWHASVSYMSYQFQLGFVESFWGWLFLKQSRRRTSFHQSCSLLLSI